MPSVFISHSSKDKPFVRRLAKALNKRGVTTWVDDRQIVVGHPIPSRIAHGISRCDFFLVVLSHFGLDSTWVERELNSAYFRAASQKADAILPVLIESVPIPTLLSSLKYADFSKSFSDGLRDLLRSLSINEEEIPFLTRNERRARIKATLTSVNRFGDLPSEVMTLVEDESYLDLFEEHLNITTDRRLLHNSLYALRYLAEGWDGRCIRRHESIRPLIQLFQDADAANDLELRREVVCALCAIDSASTREFLIRHFEALDPKSVAEILASWQHMHEWSDSPVWVAKILPLLHKYSLLPQEQCLYFDHDGLEQDLRFWVFRCLQNPKRKSSRQYIEAFLATVNYPLEALAEAAMAHWCVTRRQDYVTVLRRAARAGVSNADYFLKQIREAATKRKKRPNRRAS